MVLHIIKAQKAERRAVADVIVPIVRHKAVRNVWLPLWETPLQGPQLSRPGDSKFCHRGFSGVELAPACMVL